MPHYNSYIFVLFIIVFLPTLKAQSNLEHYRYEYEYQAVIHQQVGGQREYRVQNGIVDILTDDYAIEVEFASKWKESIGQALWYGMQTNRLPAIVLIKKEKSDDTRIRYLASTLDYMGLGDKVRLWVYPDDFSASSELPTTYNQSIRAKPEKYWLSLSNTRHNATCHFFEGSKGNYCSSKEGDACGLCGG